MKKPLLTYFFNVLFLLIVTFTFDSCKSDGIIGDGFVNTETRPITEFSGLNIGGNFDIELKQGNKFSLFLKMDDNLLDNTITEIKDNILYISSSNKVKLFKEHKIYITVKGIEDIKLFGNINFKLSRLITREYLIVSCDGKSNLDLNLHLNNLYLTAEGNNTIDLKGHIRSLNANLTGLGSFMSLQLYCNNVYLDVSGVIAAEVFAKFFLKVKLDDCGSVIYKGNPTILEESMGSSNITKYSGAN